MRELPDPPHDCRILIRSKTFDAAHLPVVLAREPRIYFRHQALADRRNARSATDGSTVFAEPCRRDS
jgi:hypothetical protein